MLHIGIVLGVTVSILFHGFCLFGIGFRMPDGSLRKERDPDLQIVLVNARHKQSPKHPQALAQANLDGGGDSAKKDDMPTSPLPPQETASDGDALAATTQKLRQVEASQQQLLAQAKATQIALQRAQTNQQTEQPADTPQASQRGLDMATATAIARQEAVVDRMLRDYAARPRKGVISPRTQEYKLAQYGEDWRIKVQRVGELNFPRSTQGSLYGSVQVSVELRPDGSVLTAEILRASPNPKLNEAALRIIKLASPYAPFPPDIRKEYDILVLVRTLNFTREDIGVTAQ